MPYFMITKLKKTIPLINGCLIFLSILTISIDSNAMISDRVTIDLISKILKKINTPNHDIRHKYPLDVEEYFFDMRVSDPKDYYFEKNINKLCDSYNCRFSIFKDGTTKIEDFNNMFEGGGNKSEEEFLDSVNKNSNKFKESLKKIVRNIEFTDQESRYLYNYVTLKPKLNIKNDGKSNFDEITVTNEGESL